MDNDDFGVWDRQWRSMLKEAYAKTELDSFANKAFACFARWISPADTRILEAGCGTGRYCIAIAERSKGAQVTGVDITRGAVMLAREGARMRKIRNARFESGDIRRMPFRDGTFDVVFSEGVVEHLRDYKKAVSEMARVAKSGGKVILAVPNVRCFPHTLYKKIVGDKFEYGYELSFLEEALVRMFKRLGLHRLEVSGFAPAHSIERLKRHYAPMYWIGKMAELGLVLPFDLLTKNFVSRRYGVEICIKGVKP